MKVLVLGIAWLVTVLIIGVVYFAIAIGVGSLVDNDTFDTAALWVAGGLTAWTGFVAGIAALAASQD